MCVVLGIKSGLYMCQVGNVDSVNIFDMHVFVVCRKHGHWGQSGKGAGKYCFYIYK